MSLDRHRRGTAGGDGPLRQSDKLTPASPAVGWPPSGAGTVYLYELLLLGSGPRLGGQAATAAKCRLSMPVTMAQVGVRRAASASVMTTMRGSRRVLSLSSLRNDRSRGRASGDRPHFVANDWRSLGVVTARRGAHLRERPQSGPARPFWGAPKPSRPPRANRPPAALGEGCASLLELRHQSRCGMARG